MFGYIKIGPVTLAVLIVTAATMYAAEQTVPTMPAVTIPAEGANSTVPASIADPSAILLTPRCASVDDLMRQFAVHGLRIECLGDPVPRLRLPVDCLRRPLAANVLVDALAASAALHVIWNQRRTRAVLYRGAPDADVDRCRTEMQSPDAVVRRQALWRASWLQDIRLLAPLVEAAERSDEFSYEAERSLERLRLTSAAAYLGDAVLPLVDRLMNRAELLKRETAVKMLGAIGTPAAFTRLEIILSEADSDLGRICLRELSQFAGDRALARLEPWTHHPDFTLRTAAVLAVGEIGGPEACRQLLAVLAEGEVAEETVTALGFAGGAELLPEFQQLLSHPNSSVRISAVLAAANAGGKQAFPLLEKAYERPELRRWVLAADGFLGGDRSQKLLAEEHGDRALRSAALYALGTAGGAEAVAMLEKYLTAADDRLRIDAARNLSKIAPPTSFKSVLSSLEVESVFDREVVLWCLCQIDPKAVLPVLKKWIEDPALRKYALPRLGLVGTPSSFDLLEVSLSDPSPDVRMAALSAAVQCDVDRALPYLRSAVDQQDANLRQGVFALLTRCGQLQDLELFARQLKDPEPGVRQMALAGAVELAGLKALGVLQTAIFDPDPSNKYFALKAMPSLPTDQAPVWIEKVIDDPEKTSRLLLARALGGLRHPREIALFKALARDPEEDVREAVWESLDQRRDLPKEAVCAMLAPRPQEPHWEPSILVCRILGRLDTEESRGLLSSLLKIPEQAPSVIQGLKDLRTPSAIALIDEAFADPRPDVRRSAAIVLDRRSRETLPGIAQKLLADPDVMVRVFTADALGNSRHPQAIPLLLARLPVETNRHVYENLCTKLVLLTQHNPTAAAKLEKIRAQHPGPLPPGEPDPDQF